MASKLVMSRSNSQLQLKSLILAALGVLAITTLAGSATPSHNYADALSKSILFFEGQRSGSLPRTQRVTWRKDSALHDGNDIHMDLVGGYYDAGDNVKFNFPMAFTTAMLSWSVLEFGESMGSELPYASEAIRWGTDYLLKSTDASGSVVGVVGDPVGDHTCWERPEDMDTPRTSYIVTREKPGTEVSAETAAALAASSMVFTGSDDRYSGLLLDRAKEVFEFADKYRGSYNDSIGEAACPFYCDFNGYMDELIWSASWLYKATKDPYYLNYVKQNMPNLGGSVTEFGWDGKHAGINILVSQLVTTDDNSPFISNSDQLVCSILPESPAPKSVTFSPGGLLFKPGGSNLQHAISLSFLLTVYADYLKAANKVVNCGNNVVITPSRMIDFTKGQVDYILGSNPLGMSYMVGYGSKFPKRIHHRASVLPSMDQQPGHIECHAGTPYFETQAPNQNLLLGAIVGGPAENDSFEDSRYNVPQSEPTTYINAPFVGVLIWLTLSPYFHKIEF